MGRQGEISVRRLRPRVGRVEPVLVESVEGDTAIARSYGDAPEINGHVIVSGADRPRANGELMVRIERADVHDLYGMAVDEPELSVSKAV